MITLWLNALDHHHRLVIALSYPPIIMHDTTKSRELYGLNGRLIMNGEWWKVVNDQWYKQVTTTYACNTMNTIPLNMLHLSLFFFKYINLNSCIDNSTSRPWRARLFSFSFLFSLCLLSVSLNRNYRVLSRAYPFLALIKGKYYEFFKYVVFMLI